MTITKGLKFRILASPTIDGEVLGVHGDEVNIMFIPSDRNAFWSAFALDEIQKRFDRGDYKLKEKEINFGI